MPRRKAGCRQHLAGQTCRDRALGKLLLPGLEIVDHEGDIGVLGDVLIAGAVEDDALNLAGVEIGEDLGRAAQARYLNAGNDSRPTDC